MKSPKIYLLLLSVFALFVASCDDTLQPLGYAIQPDSDKITVGTDTLPLSARTIAMDSIFAKTKSPILGEYEDKFYGKIRSDYAGELFVPENFSFPKGAVIEEVNVAIHYSSWVGDSLQPMQVSIYEIDKKLPETRFYTNVDFSGYYNPTPLAQKVYTAGGVSHIVTVPLDKSVGERFLKNPDKLKDTETFKDFFKGIYVTSTFGKGSVINVDYTYLNTKYSYPGVSSTTKKDTVFTSTLRLAMTPEVTQLNRVQSQNTALLAPNSDFAYLKSPAGVITELTIPLSSISSKLKSQALNLANLRLSAVPNVDSEQTFKMNPPAYVLLVPKDEMKDFFEKRKLPNDTTSFYGAFNSGTYSYLFANGNLSTMINHYLSKFNKENNGVVKDLTYVLVPVSMSFSSTSSGNTVVSGVSNLMTPTAVTLNTNPKHLRMEMIFSKL